MPKATLSSYCENIKSKAKKMAETYAKVYVETAVEKLEETTINELSRFYGDYTPRFYKRIGNLGDNVYKVVDADKTSDGYCGGIDYSPDFMQDYRVRKDWWNGYDRPVQDLVTNPAAKYAVFKYDFLDGMHGRPGTSRKNTSPSPWLAITKYFESQQFDAECNLSALAAAEGVW